MPETTSRTLRDRIRESFLKIYARARIQKEAQAQTIPIHRHVFRGWDHSTQRWHQPIWPKLNCNLDVSQEGSTKWVLDWKRELDEGETATDNVPTFVDRENEDNWTNEGYDASLRGLKDKLDHLEVGKCLNKGKGKQVEFPKPF